MSNNTLDKSPVSEPTPTPGPFLAKVVSHLDPTYMGGLEVEILRTAGNDSSEGQLHQVKYMSPFYGVTSVDYVGPSNPVDPDNKKIYSKEQKSNNNYNNTQKSYGMWMIPPDPGTTVIVIFIDGDPKRGYWIGCVQDENMNFMVPGMASTEFVANGNGTRVPVAEYNKRMNKDSSDPTKIKKPKHPFATAALTQNGLITDDIRGITTSSARRETPSMVFGISTPGPLDKGPSATRGIVGKKEHAINNAYVSRKGGSSFVMDDGDDKFVRRYYAGTRNILDPKSPDDGKTIKVTGGIPLYAAVEQGEKPDAIIGHDIPHNELVRIKTRTGHQILLHNSEDLIYISHGSGKSWIEMTANGKIDVYAEDSISFYTGNDFNFTAKNNINFETETGNINMISKKSTRIKSTETFDVLATGTANIQGSNVNLNTEGAAASATTPIRVPAAEPWKDHENLDPAAWDAGTIAKNIADNKPPVVYTNKNGRPDDGLKEPIMYKKYTASTDTFKKVKPPEKKK